MTRYTHPRKNADKLRLYECAVQDAEFEVVFAARQYRKRRGRPARILREDFCGTALVAAQWVKGRPKRSAIGLDLEPSVLRWAHEHNLAPLGKAAKRVDLRLADVRSTTRPGADIVLAYNFACFSFHTQPELVDYFRYVHRSLAPGGIMMVDSYGGWESQQAIKERRKVDSPNGTFGYVWDRAAFNPIDNRALCHIHFEFKGGKKWSRAFSYEWRWYSPVEICEALRAAGFSRCDVLWDVEDDVTKDEDFRVATRAENCPGWIVYIVAEH